MLITEIGADEGDESRENCPDINRTVAFKKSGKQELFEKWLSQT